MLTVLLRSWTSWKREKGVGVLAAVALAIGIGSATAIFTIADAVLLRPLPYTHGERWVSLLGGDTLDDGNSGLSFSDLDIYRERTRSFDVFGGYSIWGDFNLTSPGSPRHIEGIRVSPALLANTGAVPVAGRFFQQSDGPNVAMLSKRLFQQFGARIIGHPVTLNGKAYTVTGVMPAWFRLPITNVDSQNSHNDVWIPIETPSEMEAARKYGIFGAYARLKPGVTVAQAAADAKRVAVAVRKENHPDNLSYTSALSGLQEGMVKRIRPILLLIFGAAGLLLLITCANVAGLLVSRAVGRARETAIRVALGGGQGQLALQYFLESLWVSLTAAAGGILVSILLVRMIVSLAADVIPRSDEVSTNWAAAIFALGLAVLTATLSSLAPLWQALRTQPNEILSNGIRASADLRSRRLSQALVVTEIAFAFTLVSAGALLVWQLRNLTQTWPGFDPNGLFTFQLTRAGDNDKIAPYANRVIESLEAIPGVSDAAVSNQLPLAGCCLVTNLYPESGPLARQRQELNQMVVSTGYFKTMRIPLLAGRLLNAHDTNEDLVSMVISQAAAQRYWPNGAAVGQLFSANDAEDHRVQVVGVVGTVRNRGLSEVAQPEAYLLHNISPFQVMRFAVRSTLQPAAVASAIRHAIAKVDPTQPIYAMQSMGEIFNDSLIFERIESIVITLFALTALLMASLGVYGLTSYSVRQRVTELGTRMALGATNRQLLQLIAGGGLRLAGYGIASGAVAAAALAGIVVRYFHVPLSPVPYLFSMCAVALVALAASLVPAWRASLLSPMVAIRNETDSVWASALRALEQARERSSALQAVTPLDSTLLTEFIEASRRAESFSDVLRSSLHDLATKLRAESALLLEVVSPGEFRCVAAEPARDRATFSIPEQGFLLNRLKFYGSPMSFTAADLETILRWAQAEKPPQVDEIELLRAVGLRLAAPLRTKHELIGLLLFGEHAGGVPYSSAEKKLTAACAEQLALTMENAQLSKRVLEQESVKRDIALATEVQKRLLPEQSPETSAASLGAYTLAARNVGGDYYDFLRVGEHSIGIALADVAGKGIAAALIMAVVQASLRIISADSNVSLPELAAKMNRFLHRSTGFNSYATFFYARLDEDKGQLRYVNAGHNPPYLVRAGAAEAPIEELTTGGMIIGMFAAASYEEAVVDLRAGDVLIAFTDGVTEALNLAEEEFGEERLQLLIRRVAQLPVPEMTAAVARELREWIGEAPQHDDLTFVVMKVS